ncbi:MAG: glycosyltransferase family 4 protein, partial [Acidimicrobiales bacterium]
LGPLRAGLGLPYAVVLHGAEVSVPAHLPGARYGLARVLRGAELAIAGSEWAKGEARRAAGTATPGLVEITPGVDHARFRPAGRAERAATRRRLGLPGDGRLVLSVGRLVPRKGMTTLVEAAARLAHSYPDLTVAIVGSGREEARLARLVATTRAPVRLLGHLPDSDLPPLYGAADVFAQPCRARWAGMEQEGFGIVFLEAAACGVPQVAGRSGGAAEAVVHGRTGLVVDHPGDPAAVAAALGRLLDDEAHRAALGRAARARVEACFTYDHLAARLAHALDAATPGRRSRW